jgi:hypothetical protein
MTEIDIMLFIACLLGSMGSKDQSLSHLLDVLVVFLIEMESRADTVRFIKMI